jgi:hypothetical protein
VLTIGDTMPIALAGLGMILYSPSSVAHIVPGEDYLSSHFWEESDVQRHIQEGKLVAFQTGTSGRFFLKFLAGYPDAARLRDAKYKYRIAIRVADSSVCIRDLYDLLRWDPDCPEEQMLALDDGIYHVTLVSDEPASGVLGDDQVIEVYFTRLGEWPRLATEGIPTLI